MAKPIALPSLTERERDFLFAVAYLTSTHANRRPVSIQGYMGIPAPAVCRAQKKLVNMGYVTTKPDPTDGRCMIVSLSPAGKRLTDRLLGHEK